MKHAFARMALAGLVLCPFFAIAANRPTCAVLSFQPGAGCTAQEATFISDRFAALLAQLDKYDVLARSEMTKILSIQKVNMSDYCSAAECAVEAGKLLSVQFIIVGTFGHVGNLYSMNTSLVDVETGRVMSTAVTDHQGAIEDFIKGGPPDNIKSLLVAKQTPAHWDTLPEVSKTAPSHIGVRAQPEDEPVRTYPLQIALFCPVQLAPEEADIVGLRLVSLYVRNRNVSGIDFGGGLIESTGNFTGVAVGFLFSINSADVCKGVQIGWGCGANWANDMHGVQTGMFVINRAKNMRGVQLGIVNYCETMVGVQIGVINIITKSPLPFFPIVNAHF